MHGIEINPLAAELARTTIWIGDIQWRIRNGIYARPQPILRKLDSIECRDALMRNDGGCATEAKWPEAEFIVGNPPFLGNKKMIEGLGESYAQSLRAIYEDQISGGVDLVIYWFLKAWNAGLEGRTKRVGLVATNSIRNGVNREILKRIVDKGCIFDAWDDEEWAVEGAQVRVSLICFAADTTQQAYLDGLPVEKIYSNLSAASFDITTARPLAENKNISFVGVILNGQFEVEPSVARHNGCKLL